MKKIWKEKILPLIGQDLPHKGTLQHYDQMNEKAKEFNLLNTAYVDPIGLDDEKDYTTPLDLARLTTIALQNPIFSKVVSTKNPSAPGRIALKNSFWEKTVKL